MSSTETPKIVRVAIAIVADRLGRLLICRRKDDAVLGGMWEFPGGKIEPGESPEQAAEREALEELAIVVRAIRTLEAITHTYPHATVSLTPVMCEHVDGDPQAVDCAEWRWVSRADLSQYAFPAANAPLLGRLIATLPSTPGPSEA